MIKGKIIQRLASHNEVIDAEFTKCKGDKVAYIIRDYTYKGEIIEGWVNIKDTTLTKEELISITEK